MQRNMTTRLNTMQQFMLSVFDRDLTPVQEKEVKQLISDYFAGLIDSEMDTIVNEQHIDADMLEVAAKNHRRTHYAPKS